MRYRFYREHKYVSAAVNDVERLIATTDFTQADEIATVANALQSLREMLLGHAHYENEVLHRLLKNRGSTVFSAIEHDHMLYEQRLKDLHSTLQTIESCATSEEKIERGYAFYLQFRKFAGDNLLHLHNEETILLPELQRLYNDEELRVVEFDTYRSMNAEQLADMMKVLFPHMNTHDREAFKQDIKSCDITKFAEAWKMME